MLYKDFCFTPEEEEKVLEEMGKRFPIPKEVNLFTSSDTIIKCTNCKTSTKLEDMQEVENNTMVGRHKAGWNGYKYLCPVCETYLARMTISVS